MSARDVFKPLDKNKREIRLIHLHAILPAKKEGDEKRVAAHLSYTALASEQHTKYQALSYVWGEANYVSSVVLGDGSHIPITKNLLVAIEHIFGNGFAPGGFPIWIDGLCIDQSNNAEKSWQVQQMKEVYASAYTTLIFLGPGSDHSDAAIELFQETGQEAIAYGCFSDKDWLFPYGTTDRFVKRYFVGSPTDSTDPTVEAADCLLHKILGINVNNDYMPLHLVSALMNRPWWRRIWVLQELLVSQDSIFVCGYKRICADVLVAAVNLFSLLRETQLGLKIHNNPSGYRHLDHRLALLNDRYRGDRIPPNYGQFPALKLYTQKAYRTPEDDYRQLVELTQCCNIRMQATDPRDHIFPLMTLAPSHPSKTLQIQLDYSLSVASVYVQATLDLLQAKYAGILGLAVIRRSNTEVEELPSWVPDWSGTEAAYVWFGKSSSREVGLYDYKYIQEGVHVLSTLGLEYGPVEVLWKEDIPALSSTKHSPVKASHILAYFTATGQYLSRAGKGLRNANFRNNAMALSMHLAWMHPRSRLTDDNGVYEEMFESFSERLKWKNDGRIRWERNSVAAIAHLIADGYTRDPREVCDPSTDDIPWMSTHFHSLKSVKVKKAMWEHISAAGKSLIPQFLPFVCQGRYLGVASAQMQTGDILAEFDCEPHFLFILRAVNSGMYRIVGFAYVAQLRGSQCRYGVTRTTFRLC